VVSGRGALRRERNRAFDSVADCPVATFDERLARVTRLAVEAAERERNWHARVSAVLSVVLAFFDEERDWARVLIDESAIANSQISERRRDALKALMRALVTELEAEANSSEWFVPASEITAELVVGGILSVLRTRMLEGLSEPFAQLAPALTAFVTAPFPSASWRLDQQRGGGANESEWPAQRLPVRTTYRTTRVLSAIDESPGLSNREIAEAAGLSDEGQTSKLLRRLERRGLVQNFGLGQPSGGPNAWQLTPYGARVLEATRHSLVPGAGAVMGQRVRRAR
jgi:hypothetical protein